MPEIALRDIAHARSGEKGENVNLAVIAYDDSDYEFLRENLTAAVVAEIYGPLLSGTVERYEAPNISGLNFVLTGALRGGRSRTLAVDESSKALSSLVLAHTFPPPDTTAGTEH